MKKLFTVLLAVLMLVSISGCSEKKDRLETIKEKGVITVATEGDWSPYTYHDETTNELVGFDVELGKLIADKLGVQVEYNETDWDSILAGVQSGRYDLGINGITYTEERAKSYNFSEFYAQMDAVLITKTTTEDINTFEDLEGKISTNSTGSIYADWAVEYGATVEYVATFQDTVNMLVSDRADASINALSAFNDYVRAKEDAGEDPGIKIVAYADPEKYVIASMKDASTDSLIAEVNKILDELRADGSLAALSEKYFGYDATVISD